MILSDMLQKKADYKGTGENGAITDADIKELSVKLVNHLNKVDISAVLLQLKASL